MNGNDIVVKLFALILIVIGFLMTRYSKLKKIELPFLSGVFKPLDGIRKVNEDLWNKALFGKLLSYNRITAIAGVVAILLGLGLLFNKM